MEDEASPKVVCTIEKLKLPKLFPSLLFVSWKFGHKKGKTQFYRANVKDVIIGESIQIEVPKRNKHQFKFSIFVKAISGEISQVGECSVCLPTAQEMSCAHHVSQPVDSHYGTFELGLSFEIKYVDKINADVEMILKRSEIINSIGDYTKIIGNMNPLLSTQEDVINTWGDNGVLANSAKIEHSKYMLTAKEPVFGIRERLVDLEKESKRCSNLITDVFSMLMKPKPVFLTMNYKEKSPSEDERVIPLLALRIAQDLKYNDMNAESISIALITICTSFADLLKSQFIINDWILCIAATSMFIVSYINKHKLTKFDVSVPFDTVGKHAIVQYVTNIVGEIHNCCGSPMTFADKMRRLNRSLKNLSFPESIMNIIYQHIMNSVDFLVTRSWIMTGEMDQNILIGFTSAFPGFQFQLINTLFDILHFSDELVHGQIKVSDIHPLMRGQWLADILQKLCQFKQYSPSIVTSLPIADAPSPTAPNEKDLDKALSSIEIIIIDVPDNLPSPPTEEKKVID